MKLFISVLVFPYVQTNKTVCLFANITDIEPNRETSLLPVRFVC